MSIEALREELIENIRKADESKLLLVKRTIEEAQEDNYVVPAEELEIAYARREAYLRGEGQSYTMEEAHALIRQQYAEGKQ